MKGISIYLRVIRVPLGWYMLNDECWSRAVKWRYKSGPFRTIPRGHVQGHTIPGAHRSFEAAAEREL
jgi:hypothetical protein